MSNTPKTSEAIPQVRILFMGTPLFAKMMLEHLVNTHFNIVAVVTRPDRPAGRSQDIAIPEVKAYADAQHIPVLQPEKLDDETLKNLATLKPDLIVVAAYGKILPKKLLEMPGLGCINVHASLLPRWRGASPIHNALLAGDTKTGITIMFMDEGMDTGAILAQQNVEIDPHDTYDTLTEKLIPVGADLLEQTANLWIRRKIEPRIQNDEDATLCQLIERDDGRIFWDKTADEIYNQYRALTPWPGVFTFWKRGAGEFERIKMHRLSIQHNNPATTHQIGEVFETGTHIGVQTAVGVILIEELQLSGKAKIPIKEFLNGRPDFIGSLLV